MYSDLFDYLRARVYENTDQDISGTDMQETLEAMITELGAGYQFFGVVQPDSPLPEPVEFGFGDFPAVFLATDAGEYTNFDNFELDGKTLHLFMYDGDGNWSDIDTGIPSATAVQDINDLIATKQDTLTFDPSPVAESLNPVTSGGIFSAIESAKGATGLAEALLDTDSAGSVQEFALRKSGGDGGAYFRRLLGNTKAFNQMVENGDFSNGTTGWTGGPVVVDGVATKTLTATGTPTSANISKINFPYINGHKYLFVALAKSNNAGTYLNIVPTGAASDGTPGHAVYPNWTLITYIWTRTGTGTTLSLRGDNQPNPDVDIDFSVRFCMCTDLTAMQDNSATADEFREKYPLLYYAYGRKLIHNKVASVKTRGANQWDEQSLGGKGYSTSTGALVNSANRIASKNPVRIFGGAEYYAKFSRTSTLYLFYYDADMNFISYTFKSASGTFTPPANAAYLNFMTYNDYGEVYTNDICINLSDADINGQYFPYWERELAIDITNREDTDGNTPFAEGAKSCPVAADEWNEVGGIVRVGVRAYQASDDTDASVITDGVNTAYALTTPVPFTWKEPLNTGIKVSKYGTEEITPAQTENIDTAPFRAVTTYSISIANLLAALSALGNRGGAKGSLGSGNEENPENEEQPKEEEPKEEEPETPVVEPVAKK